MQNLSALAAAPENSQVVGAIKQASARSGVDFSYLMQQASTESSLNPSAKASTSSASGLYQFIDQTWLTEMSQHGAEFGLAKQAAAISTDSSGRAYVSDAAERKDIMALKNDPTVAAEMAAAFTKDNKSYLQSAVGGAIGGTELYLAHFLGAGGAAKFLTAMKASPGTSAASVLPQAADANEPVFYHADGTPRSLGEVYQRFAAKFSGTANGGSSTDAQTIATQYSAYAGSAMSSSIFGSSALSTSATGTSGTLDAAEQWGNAGRASLYEMMLLSQIGMISPTGASDANTARPGT